MEKKHIIFGFIIFLAAGLLFLVIERQREEASLAMAPEEQEESSQQRISTRISANEIRHFREVFPDKDQVKTESSRNPNSTPESLVRFASAMGPLMEKAYQNDQAADILIKELHNCATDRTVARSARALCVSNAQKIARTHPYMKDKADQIRASADPAIMDMLKKRDQSQRK